MTQQYEKNPNGGYGNPSKFGGYWGKVEITKELVKNMVEQIKGGAAVAVIDFKVGEEKQNQKGEPYVRLTFKEHDFNWKQNQPQKQAVNAAPQAAAPAADLDDEIPF